MKSKFLFTIVSLLSTTPLMGKVYIAQSPDGQIHLAVNNNKTATSFSIAHNTTHILQPSQLAMKLLDGKNLGCEQANKAVNTKATDYNQLTLNFNKYAIEFRVYNQGVAYRFVTNFKDSICIENEINEFVFPSDCITFQCPANSKDNQSLDKQTKCSFENIYLHEPISKLNKSHLGLAPMLVEIGDSYKFLIGNYNVRCYPGMFLLPDNGNTIRSFYPRYPKKEHQGGHNNLQYIVDEWESYIAKTKGTRTFPWKIMILAKNDIDLLNATMQKDLADKPTGDYSWVKPGKVAWDWWNAWNLKGVDFKTGVNNNTYKYYIDFASKNGIEYVILDEGWAVNKKADLMQVVPEIDLKMLIQYAKERNVGIILWAGYVAFDRDMEKVCNYYSKLGVKGFKTDFLDRNDQKAMEYMERAAITAAKYKLFLDFHGGPTPDGMQITHPNALNFEGVKGLENVKWNNLNDFDEVRHETIIPFIRQVMGPLDYTQGAMRNATKKSYSPCYTQPMSQGTRCRQLALYVLFNSPFNMLCDTPTNYESNIESLQFISKVPVTWDERKPLDAKIGEYVIEACRKGDKWWIGGITNWKERDITVNLDFLAEQEITLYTDGPNANKNAEDYKIETVVIPSNGTLNVHLAPGGAFAAFQN